MATSSSTAAQAHPLLSPTYQLIALMTTPYRIPKEKVPSAIDLFERITTAFVDAQAFSASSAPKTASNIKAEIKPLKVEILLFMQTFADVWPIQFKSQSDEPLVRAEHISRYALNSLKTFHSFTSSSSFENGGKCITFSLSQEEEKFYHIFDQGSRFERGNPIHDHMNYYSKDGYQVVSKSVEQKDFQSSLNATFFMRYCQHPNVMPLTAVLESSDTKLEIAMPYCSSERMQLNSFESEFEILEFLTPFLKGLTYIHSLDVVHHNISPGSFYEIDSDQSDFTRVIGGFKFATFRGSKVKAPVNEYSAPEQILRKDPSDSASDVWAIGCVLFRVLYGESLFPPSFLKNNFEVKNLLREPNQKTFNAFLYKRIKECTKNKDCDPDFFLQEQIQNCLRLNPDERPSARTLLYNFKDRWDDLYD